jgi:flavin reductase (DIM6/NTAB) family NADH-FMN oxidoreductase RutF
VLSAFGLIIDRAILATAIRGRGKIRRGAAPLDRHGQCGNGEGGVPILDAALAVVEYRVTSIVEQGDHHIVVGEVTEAHLPKPIEGRPDVAILEMKDLGDNVFYGG